MASNHAVFLPSLAIAHSIGVNLSIHDVEAVRLNAGLQHSSALTSSGQTVAEVLAAVPNQPPTDQAVIRPFAQLKQHNHGI